jgi:hypothetical protein
MKRPTGTVLVWSALAVLASTGVAFGVSVVLSRNGMFPGAPNPDPGPKNTIIVDIGAIKPGESLVRQVEIVNSGTVNWTLKGVSSDCSCIGQQFQPSILAPGKAGKLDIRFRASQGVGSIQKHVFVGFHESEAPVQVVVIKGVARAWATASPILVEFGDVIGGARTSRRLQVLTPPDEHAELDREKSELPNCTVTYVQSKRMDFMDGTCQDVAEYDIALALPVAIGTSPWMGKLRFVSPSEKVHQLDVPLTASVCPPIQCSSEQVFFGMLVPGESAVCRVRLTPHTKADVLLKASECRVSHDLGDQLDVAVLQGEGGGLLLEVRHRAGRPKSSLVGHLTVDVGVGPAIVLPVSAYVNG